MKKAILHYKEYRRIWNRILFFGHKSPFGLCASLLAFWDPQTVRSNEFSFRGCVSFLNLPMVDDLLRGLAIGI